MKLFETRTYDLDCSEDKGADRMEFKSLEVSKINSEHFCFCHLCSERPHMWKEINIRLYFFLGQRTIRKHSLLNLYLYFVRTNQNCKKMKVEKGKESPDRATFIVVDFWSFP